MKRAERFHPYGTHENAVQGSPTLVFDQPTGGKPETSADAEDTINTEGNKAAVSSFYRSRPLHVIEWSFDVRSRSGLRMAKGLLARIARSSSETGPSSSPGPKSGRVCGAPRASTWHLPVSAHRNQRNDAPDTIAAAVEVIPTIRPMVYQNPHLLKSQPKETEPVSKYAMIERGRRKVESSLCGELSKYYTRENGLWPRSELLAEGKPRVSPMCPE